MAEEFTVMVKGAPNIEQLICHLEQIVGHCFVKSQKVEWNLYQTNVLQIHIDVFDDHGFVNNLGIDFERFDFAIDIQASSPMGRDLYYIEWLRLCALMISKVLARKWEYECMIVQNLQRIVEVFPSADGSQVDRFSKP